jgi:hypothetical protein
MNTEAVRSFETNVNVNEIIRSHNPLLLLCLFINATAVLLGNVPVVQTSSFVASSVSYCETRQVRIYLTRRTEAEGHVTAGISIAKQQNQVSTSMILMRGCQKKLGQGYGTILCHIITSHLHTVPSAARHATICSVAMTRYYVSLLVSCNAVISRTVYIKCPKGGRCKQD